MEYFMVPAQKVPSSLQHFRKTEKDVIGGLCRYVQVAARVTPHAEFIRCLLLREAIWWWGCGAGGGFAAHALKATCFILARSVIVCTTHSRAALGIELAPNADFTRRSGRARSSARTPACYLAYSSAKSTYFEANKHKPRGCADTMLLPCSAPRQAGRQAGASPALRVILTLPPLPLQCHP